MKQSLAQNYHKQLATLLFLFQTTLACTKYVDGQENEDLCYLQPCVSTDQCRGLMVCIDPRDPRDHPFCAYKGWARFGIITGYIVGGMVAVFILIAIWVYIVAPCIDMCENPTYKRNYEEIAYQDYQQEYDRKVIDGEISAFA